MGTEKGNVENGGTFNENGDIWFLKVEEIRKIHDPTGEMRNTK